MGLPHLPGIYMVAGGLELGSLACVAGALAADLSPLPLSR